MMQNPIKRHNIKLRHLFINGKTFRRIHARRGLATAMWLVSDPHKGPLNEIRSFDVLVRAQLTLNKTIDCATARSHW